MGEWWNGWIARGELMGVRGVLVDCGAHDLYFLGLVSSTVYSCTALSVYFYSWKEMLV